MNKYYKKTPKPSIGSTSQEPRQIESNSAEEELPSDPGLRRHISQYNPNEQDSVRRSYLLKKSFQPYNHNFPQREIGGKMRRFNKDWFNLYNTWLEYSIDKDAAFYHCCYLFRPNNVGSGGRTIFVGDVYRNWKSKKVFDEHVGDSNSLHNQAYRMCLNLMDQNQSIQTVFDRHIVKQDIDYRIQLNATVDTIRLLLRQGLAFRGHDESECSNNPGNFLEFMRFLGDHNKEINKVILNNSPQNLKLIAPKIQKDIVNACAEETIKEVIAELGDGWFSVLVDEMSQSKSKWQL